MKKIFYLFLILILVLLIAFISAYIFINLKGKVILTNKLQEALHRKVNIGDISASFPLDVKITDLDIENLLKVDEVYFSFGAIDLLRRNIELPAVKLIKPQITIERTETSGSFPFGPASGASLNTNYSISPSGNNQAVSAVGIIINKLIIRDGQIKFIDKTVSPEVFKLDINNVNLRVSKLSFPIKPFTMQIDLSADVITNQKKAAAPIKTEGWIDFLRKDMQATFEINNLDGTYFYPYYQKFLGKKLKTADVSFKADLVAKNNDLTADCNLKIKDLLFEEPQETELTNITVLDIIGGSLANKARDIELNFVIKTKLDNPKIDSAQIRGIVLDKVLETVVTQPPEETIKTIEDIGDKLKDIGKELEDKFKGIFKKE